MDEDVLASPASSAPPRVAPRVTAASAAGGRSGAASFDDFFRSELPRLRALARALCGSAVADDLAQEALLAAYRSWPRIAGYDNPEAWVRRVCANHATSLLRRRSAEARALLRVGSRPTRMAEIELDPSHEALWAEVRRLPRRQAQAAALRYVYDLTIPEIATTLGCSDGAVKSHLSRARATLAERLGLPERGAE